MMMHHSLYALKNGLLHEILSEHHHIRLFHDPCKHVSNICLDIDLVVGAIKEAVNIQSQFEDMYDTNN
jgi:hypothetical protein